jgi:hypothetical protein
MPQSNILDHHSLILIPFYTTKVDEQYFKGAQRYFFTYKGASTLPSQELH